MVTIKFSTANDAFSDAPGQEVARILHKLADTVAPLELWEGEEVKLRDINGNTVGTFKYTNN